MSKVLVTGIVNMEMTVKVAGFPIPYVPIEYSTNSIRSVVSGSGFNIAKAMQVLEDEVELLSIIGIDQAGRAVKAELLKSEIGIQYVESSMKTTPQSVVLVDGQHQTQIFCDLKDIQELKYNLKTYKKAIADKDLVVIGNSNFCRPFLQITKKEEKKIAVNVHAITTIDDKYNKEFMKYANILFIGDDYLDSDPYEFVKKVAATYHNEIIILGRGAKGAILYVKDENFIGEFPAVKTREIISTAGAGDALFSAFLHFYLKKQNPYMAIKSGILFASYMIGSVGSSKGFLAETQIEQYYPIIWRK